MSKVYKLTLLPYGKINEQRFEVEYGELILDAAIRQNVKLPYSCRNGTCRTCIVQVQDGIVKQEDSEFCMISDSELENGKRLVCMSTVQSDATVKKIGPKAERT